MDDEDNCRDDILWRKRSHIVDDDDDDDVYDDDNDDNNNNDDDNDSPPGINDSLALNIDAFQKEYNPSRRQLKKRHKKGGEKRSGSNVVNVAWGCNLPSPPPAQGRSRSRSGSNNTTVERGSKAPSPSQGGKKRSRLNVAMVARGGEPPPPPQSWRGSNPQQTQRNKRTKKEDKKEEQVSISLPHSGQDQL
jgi:hypothetical protein